MLQAISAVIIPALGVIMLLYLAVAGWFIFKADSGAALHTGSREDARRDASRTAELRRRHGKTH